MPSSVSPSVESICSSSSGVNDRALSRSMALWPPCPSAATVSPTFSELLPPVEMSTFQWTMRASIMPTARTSIASDRFET